MSRVLTLLATAALLLVGLAVPIPAQADDPIPTTLELTIEAGSLQGMTFQPVATVTSASGTPTGTVTFSGSVPTTTVPLDASGTASMYHQDMARTHTVTATFNGTNGYGPSSSTVTKHTEDYIEWDPEPTVAWLGPNFQLTMTMATYLYDYQGEPMAGARVAFTLLDHVPAFPYPAPKPYLNVCEAVADANGLATCKGSGFVGSMLSLLTNGAYATYYDGPFSSDAWTKLPVVRFR